MNNPAASSEVSNLWKDLKFITASDGEFNPKRLNLQLDLIQKAGCEREQVSVDKILVAESYNTGPDHGLAELRKGITHISG